MATVTAASNLNAEANVFSPVSMSKLKMDLLKIQSEAKDLDGNDYEERILIKKMVQRTDLSVVERRNHQFAEYCRFCKNNGEKESRDQGVWRKRAVSSAQKLHVSNVSFFVMAPTET